MTDAPPSTESPGRLKWTAKQDARLLELHYDGLQADAIAVKLQAEDIAASRGAVIGRLWRLGVPAAIGEGRRKRRKPVAAATVTEPAEPVQILDLLPHHCRWPVTPDRPWGFCGRQQMAGSSYCVEHARESMP
jgi:hypothetical protein